MLRIIALALILSVGGSIFFAKGDVKAPAINFQKTQTPQPFLFQELTIPFLREREYKSKLGELTKYQERENYTSFVTSYDSDGLKVNGLLTIPKGRGPFPAIVFIHGYIAPTIYKTTEKYTDYVDYLARNGFVVFKIDLRGHDQSEGEPGGAYYSSDYIIDTLNAYSALQNADFVDKDRVGLWGHSMAGNVIFRSVAVKKDIPAVVIWAGAGYTYSDLADYRLMDGSYRPPSTDSQRRRHRELLNDTYGSFDPESWFWKQVPGTNYLDGVLTSLEIHHAIDDSVVSVEYSRNLMNILDGTTIPHNLLEYQSGGHNISGSSFSDAMRATVEFFQKNL